MSIPLQLPDGTVVLSNRFGNGPFDDCQPFVEQSRTLLAPFVRTVAGAAAYDRCTVGATGDGRGGDDGQPGPD
jgi:hypothetical protein